MPPDRIPAWHPRLSVDNALLDKHHILLLELARSLVADAPGLDRESLCLAVEDILQLAERHCAAEEHQLLLNGYEWVDQHREEHAAGLDRLRAVLAEYARGAIPSGDVCSVVVNWLDAHITDMDLPARGYLRHAASVDPDFPDPLEARAGDA